MKKKKNDSINAINELSCGFKRWGLFRFILSLWFLVLFGSINSLLVIINCHDGKSCMSLYVWIQFWDVLFKQHLPDSCRYLYTRKLTSSLLILIFTPAYTMRSAHRTQAWERKDKNNIRKPSHRMTLKMTTEEVWILPGFLPSTQECI